MELKAENISFKYPFTDEYILKDVYFSIKNGEIKGLFGSSGSGKSTLCKILSGFLESEGTVRIDNTLISDFKGYFPVQLIFQHPEKTMNPKWKMRQVLEEAWDVDDELIESFGIKKSWLNRWPIELSGGELQRFSVLRALSPDTKFLIADEMTTMLDAITQAQIWDLVVKRCKELDIGLIVISHDSHLVDRICDDVVYLNDINHI